MVIDRMNLRPRDVIKHESMISCDKTRVYAKKEREQNRTNFSTQFSLNMPISFKIDILTLCKAL